MARKRKPKPFRKVTAVKAAAREQIGTPPPTRRQTEISKKPQPKHKRTLGEILSENEL